MLKNIFAIATTVATLLVISPTIAETTLDSSPLQDKCVTLEIGFANLNSAFPTEIEYVSAEKNIVVFSSPTKTDFLKALFNAEGCAVAISVISQEELNLLKTGV